MSLISYIKREEATGQIADIYDMLEQRIKVIPNVVQFYTASPELFIKFMGFVGHYIDHPTLNAITVAYTRMLISHKSNADYCVKLQSGILESMKVTKVDLELAKKDYTKINLDEKNKALVCFVLDMMFGKLENAKERINHLKVLGWADKDIFEASVMGAIQKGMVNVIKAFEVQLDF